jgi:colicin import membrane protein
MRVEEQEITALAVIEPKDIQTVFTAPSGLDPILEKIAKEARSFTADVNTPTGRKSIASVAFKVAKTKTYLDGLGKELVDGLKELPKKVDANRKAMRDFLDELKDEVRRPLTEWEQEQERIEAEMKARAEAERLQREVENAHELAILLNAEFDRKKEDERKAAEQREKERLELIASQAAEKARLEAEAKAKVEQEAALRREVEAKMAQQRAEKERADAERRAAEAEERATKAREEAIRQERERVESIERKAKEEQEKREADKEHRRRINAEIIADLASLGFDEDTAKALITSISKGKVRHTSIAY